MDDAPGDRRSPQNGDEFRYPDGTTEVVVAVEGSRVLSLREYPTLDRFRTATADAEATGTNETVAALPDVDAFRGSSGSDPTDSGPAEGCDRDHTDDTPE